MTTPIRILQVFSQMNRGGAETMIMNLYRNMDRTKVQFDFIVHTNEKCAYDDEIKALGGNIFRIEIYKGTNHFSYRKSWVDFFRNNPQYKIIHGHIRSTASIYLRIANDFGLITIAHSHNTSSGSGLSAIVKNILQYPIRYTANYLFACSTSAGEWLFGEKACQKKNYYLIKNAIDSEQFTYNQKIRLNKRKELDIEDNYVVGHIGRFNSQKNHSFLIDIFKELHSKNKNAVLLLIGNGTLKNEIKDKVSKYKLNDCVIFAGVREDISDLLQAMDVFLMPSHFEGLPVTLIEAQASGTKCVVSDTITDEVDITNLIKFIPLNKTAEYWAEYIIKNSLEHISKDTYEEVCNAGYDIKENVQWLETFYIEEYNKLMIIN